MTHSSSVLLSTAYLPPVEYFYYLLKAGKVVVEQFETYPRQTYRNRCVILTANGKLSLTVPVKKVNGNHTMVRDVAILNDEKWQQKHWRAFSAAYSASPYFLYYADELDRFFTKKYVTLLNFNTELTLALCRICGFEPVLSLTDSFRKNDSGSTDLRTAISPKSPPTLSNFPAYTQVFSDRHGFHPNLSIVDLLFNLGPEARTYLEELKL